MRRAAALLIGLALAVVAGAASGARPPVAIVVEGPNAGVRLDVAGEIAGNDTLDATGTVGRDAHCAGLHYHGTMKGRPDPDPGGCGWGRVVLSSNATDLLASLSGAIDYEEKLLRTPGGQHAAAALEYLSRASQALDEAARQKKLTATSAARIRTLIEQAKALDREYHDRDRRAQLLTAALERKRAALELVLDAGLKVSEAAPVAPPACKGSFGLARGTTCFKSDTWDVNVPLGVRSALCDFRAGTRTITGARPLFPGVGQTLSCTVTGRTRVVDGVRKRIVHAELKLTVETGAPAVAPKRVRVAVRWPA